MRHLPLLVLLNSGCDEPTETEEATMDTAQAEEPAPDTEAPAEIETDTGSKAPENAEPCKVDKGHPTASVFFCLEGMTCLECDSVLELVIKAEFSCVLDADLTYGGPPGLLVEMYEGMVETDDLVDIIELDNSLYTISCIEER